MLSFLLIAALFLTAVSANDGNPFEQGCLFETKGAKLRVCNSQDAPDAQERGLCRPSSFPSYMEIRLFAQNWESPVFETWLLQIVLSELLDVPTSVEMGVEGLNMNFYNPQATFEFGEADDLSALKTASQAEGSDCLKKTENPNGEYTTCAHFFSEWWTSDTPEVQDAIKSNDTFIEVPQSIGVVGLETWYIPKFVLEQDPSLASYIGLTGEANRQKLAETFLRPTTWLQYCTQVSTTNCSTPDGVAERAPASPEEEELYFLEGIYTGHFRATPENDCDLNPTGCTGHMVDYPCGWSSFMEAQAFHLGIALESNGPEQGSGGYRFESMLEIWDAASATKSPVISRFWRPTPQYAKYRDKEAEFYAITFPPPNKQCLDERVSKEDRCSENQQTRVGDPAGVCGEPPITIDKLIVSTLRDAVQDPNTQRATWSPAYQVLNLFKISELQMYSLFDEWNKDRAHPREAICRWAVENEEYLRSLIPSSYPRVIEEETGMTSMSYATTVLGSVTVALVLATIFFVQRRRDKASIRCAQINFLRILLAGCLIIAIGAVVVGIPPTDASCVAGIWLINMGYTLQLVPLIVKIAAINTMMKAAARMRRTTIKMQNLLLVVAAVSGVMVLFLILWTVLDPPVRQGEYTLTDRTTEDGTATIIEATFYCRSKSNVWVYIAVGWDTLLLLCASVLAFQTRNLRQDFNESRTLAVLIYSHFVFVLLRLATYFLRDTGIPSSTLAGTRSIIYSVDTIATIFIYFLPKLFTNAQPTTSLARSSDTTAAIRNAVLAKASQPRTESGASGSVKSAGGPTAEVLPASVTSSGTMTTTPPSEQPPNATPGNSVKSSVTILLPSSVPCKRCGYLEEEQHLLEEGVLEQEEELLEQEEPASRSQESSSSELPNDESAGE